MMNVRDPRENQKTHRDRAKRRAPTAAVAGELHPPPPHTRGHLAGGSSQAPSAVGGSADSKELTYVDDGFVIGQFAIEQWIR